MNQQRMVPAIESAQLIQSSFCVWQVAQKAVQRWRNQKLSAGFNTWWQWWVEIRSQQQVLVLPDLHCVTKHAMLQAMQGALGRWQHQKLTAAWNSWMISIDAAAHYALAEGFLAKWKNQALWGAMSTWVSAHNCEWTHQCMLHLHLNL